MLATSPRLVESILGAAGDQLSEYAGHALGLGVSTARLAVEASLSELVAELARQSASAADPARIYELVMAPNLYRDVVTNLNALFANERAAEPLIAHGNSVLEGLVGANAAAVRTRIARRAGLAEAQIAQLLPIVASIGIGTLKADMRREQMTEQQLKRLLATQIEHANEASEAKAPSIAAAAPAITPAAPAPAPREVRPRVPAEGVRLAPRPIEVTPSPRAPAAKRVSGARWLIPIALALAAAIVTWYAMRPARTPARTEIAPTPAATIQTTPARAPEIAAKAAQASESAAAVPVVATSPAQSATRRIRLAALRFEIGSATPLPEAHDALAQTLRLLDPNDVVVVEGFADSLGDSERNRAISSARARSVAQLLRDLGLEDKRIIAVGRADETPVAPNDSEDGRTRNRRVELVITAR